MEEQEVRFLETSWLRGVKRSPQEFDDLVLRIMSSRPERAWTALGLAERMQSYNGGMPVDVHRTLRSLKRLQASNKISLVHKARGWFNWYEGKVKNG